MTQRPPQRALEADDTRLDVIRYLRVVWRRRLLLILAVLFSTSITAVGVRFLSPLYVSRAKLLLEQRTRVNSELERRIVDEDRRVKRKDQLAQVRSQVYNREFLEGVILELGLLNDASILAKAKLLHDTRTPDVPTEEIAMRILVRGLRRKLEVKVADDNMFTIAVADNDAESAYILAKVIARSFVGAVKRERMQKLEELFKFSSQQQRLYREKVDEAERDLHEFQAQLIREQNAAGLINMTNVASARSEVKRLQLDVELAQNRIDALRDVLRPVFAPIPDVRSLSDDKETAVLTRRLRAGLEDVSTTELQRAPGTQAAYDNTGGVRSALRRRVADLVESRWADVDEFYRDRIAEYAYEALANNATRAVADDLNRQVTRYTSRTEAQPEQELQLSSLQNRANQARTSLETFERTLQSAELSETILATELAGGVSVADPPEKPVSPVKPNKGRLVFMAFLMALIGGLGCIFALEYLDKSFKDIDEIEQVLSLHVIGTVPRVTEGLPFGGMPANTRRRWVMAVSMLLLVIVLSGMALYERLLRKEHMTVPRQRVEEILRDGDAPPAAAPAPASAAATPSRR